MNNNNMIDLHVHSNASDGTLTPSEVVTRAFNLELKAIALTDHDTVKGIPEAIASAAALNNNSSRAIEIIPGIEMSCEYMKREIHILGFFVDYESTSFKNALVHIQQVREDRNLRMIELFQKDGIDVTIEKLQAGNPHSVITRAHFARVLLEEGVCRTKDQAFRKYIGVGCPYYLPRTVITPEYAFSLITEAGGMPFIAHPLLYKLGYTQIEAMISDFIPLGLKGLEVYHSSNNWYESDKLRSIALKYSLLTSGGSDFHGANKPDIELGIGRGGLAIHESLLINMKSHYQNQ